jgi:predicted RNase H-like nuclease (RuvC/YqgF family)
MSEYKKVSGTTREELEEERRRNPIFLDEKEWNRRMTLIREQEAKELRKRLNSERNKKESLKIRSKLLNVLQLLLSSEYNYLQGFEVLETETGSTSSTKLIIKFGRFSDSTPKITLDPEAL